MKGMQKFLYFSIRPVLEILFRILSPFLVQSEITMENVPIYSLYGEYLASDALHSIHYEPIKERSSKHGWVIQSHKHEQLAQLFYFHNPGVEIRVGDLSFTTKEPTILFIPKMTVHGFNFPKDMIGDVISFQLTSVAPSLSGALSGFRAEHPLILTENNTQYFTFIIDLIQQFRRIYGEVSYGRSDLLDTIASLILTYVKTDSSGLALQTGQDREQSLHERQVHQFCKRVEERFRQNARISDYASDLGVSAPHLTRVTNKILGMAPNDFIRRRRIVEAKRLLYFTQRPIEEIAFMSGFKDVGFFSRTFKSHVGQTPGKYRKDSGN